MLDSPKILILSDIHLGTLSDIPEFTVPERISPEFIEREASAIKAALDRKGLKSNMILVPGDLTSQGTPLEFSECNCFVKRVSEILNIPQSRVIITYGNHDVDWRVGAIESEDGVKRDLYRSLGALSSSLFFPSSGATHVGVEVGSGIYTFEDLSVIVLNSGRFCYPASKDSKHEYHHGRIGEAQLAWLRTISRNQIPYDRPCILMIHHHLINLKYPTTVADISTLEEGPEIMSEVGRLGVDLVLHGHRHHPILFAEVQTGWSRPVSFLCAGSYGVASHHRSSGMIPNTFHHVEFEGRGEEENHCGYVTTFERSMDRSWTLIQNSMPNMAVDAEQSFGSATTQAVAKSKIDSVIRDATHGQPQPVIVARLPKYRQLDRTLRCLRIHELNNLLAIQAATAGFELTGAYPETCILTLDPQ